MSCKSCSDVTLLSGTDGNGIQTVVDNGNGTFTFFFTDGSTFTTPDFDGTAGAPGAAATLAVGAVTTGAPGTAPTVTNTGSSSAAVFAFQFPIGIGHDNTLFVDLVFGATAGVRERIDKPWNTIGAAMTAATAGDTVHIRAGSYTEDITLKNGVDIYCEEGVVINGKITDAAAPVVCNVTGNAILIDSNAANQCIEITGANSDVEIHLRRITNTGTGILQKPVSASNKLLVETDIFSGNTTNYFVTVRGAADCTVIVNQYAESAVTSSTPFQGVDARQAFSGTLNFRCPRVIIGTSTNITGGVALQIEPDTTNTAKIFFEVDTLISNYSNSSASPDFGTLSINGSGKSIIKIKDLKCISRVGLQVGGSDVVGGSPVSTTGITIFEGMIFSRDNAALRVLSYENVASLGKVIVRNSSLMRGVNPVASGNLSTVVIFGDAGFGTDSVRATCNYMKVELINTQVIKQGGTSTDSTANPIIALTGANSELYLKDCDVVHKIIEQASSIVTKSIGSFSAAGVLANSNGSVFYKNTIVTKALTTGTGIPIALGGTTVTVNANLETYNYLHTS